MTDPLTTHRALTNRWWRWYLGIIGIVAAVVGTGVGVVWSHAEITHVTLRPATSRVAGVPLVALSATPVRAWSVTDRAATGQPYDGGTVVTYSAHTVSGRDGQTGAVRWFYRRSDRVVCAVVQEQSRTIALYLHDGNCDEATAFDTATGLRQWTRTLTDDGRPTIEPTQSGLYLVTPAQVHAIDLFSGLDFWVYTPPVGCSIASAVVGSTGVLISQKCGQRSQLVLRDRTLADDNDAKKNPVLFTIASDLIPATSDDLLTAVDPTTRRLTFLDPASGKVTGRAGSLGTGTPPGLITQALTQTLELIELDGTVYAVRIDTAQLVWSAVAAQVPTVTPLQADADPAAGTSVLALAGAGQIVELDPATGRDRTRIMVAEARPGDTVYPYGSGLVLAQGSGTTVYR